MNRMSQNLKSHLSEIGGTGISTIGVITAYQQEIEFWLRCGASLVAIIAGLLTIRSLIKKK